MQFKINICYTANIITITHSLLKASLQWVYYTRLQTSPVHSQVPASKTILSNTVSYTLYRTAAAMLYHSEKVRTLSLISTKHSWNTAQNIRKYKFCSRKHFMKAWLVGWTIFTGRTNNAKALKETSWSLRSGLNLTSTMLQ